MNNIADRIMAAVIFGDTMPNTRLKYKTHIPVSDEDVAEYIKVRVNHLSELEETAPFGRCRLCNLALENEEEESRDMHQVCWEDFYE